MLGNCVHVVILRHLCSNFTFLLAGREFGDVRGEHEHRGGLPLTLASVFLSLQRRTRCEPVLPRRERIFIELMTSDRKLKASREGSK